MVGAEHSFDSVLIDGELVWHSISRYLPTPLEVLENPWIQWAVLLPRDISGDEFDPIRTDGLRGLRALGLRTGLTHMEWFRGPGGDIAISEVAARPPGAQFTSLLSYAHDVDMYAAWARLEIFGDFLPPERRYAVGAAYLRGQGSGSVVGIHGLDTLQRELGDLVVEAQLPREGQSPSGTYEGEGHVILRHPETSVVEAGLRRVVEVARVELRRRVVTGDGADDLAGISGGDAVLHPRPRARRSAGHRRGRSIRLRRSPTWHATTSPRTGRCPHSPTRTRSFTKWCGAPPAFTSITWHRCGSRRWCWPRGFARRSASPG